MMVQTGRRLSKRRCRRLAVREHLQRRDFDGLRALADEDPNLLSGVVALLSEPDALVRWRAIEALGLLGGELAVADPDAARQFVRRLLWNLTEESGNQAWSVPEAIGAILYEAPPLAPEYGVILIQYEEEPIYRPGALWALWHLAGRYPDIVASETALARQRLGDPDAFVRTHAALALGVLKHSDSRDRLVELASDPEVVQVYSLKSGELTELTVGQAAQTALAQLP